MTDTLRIVSVCRALPTPASPTDGLFVYRRLSAMAGLCHLTVVQPIPFFPLVRPLPAWSRESAHEHGGMRIEHAPMFYLPKILKSLDAVWLGRALRRRVAELHSRGVVDVLDAHFGYPEGAGCARLGHMLGIPVVVTFRGVEQDYLQVPAVAGRIRDSLRQVSGVISVSHTLRQMAIDAGADPETTAVIHNAVDKDRFRPRDQGEARARVGVDPHDKLIVSVGNLLSVKRHATLIRALARLRSEVAAARLVIIGGAMHEPEHPAELRRLCESLGLADAVTFAGRLPERDVSTWLNAADLFALASRREGCCNAILEALASGLPVVATSVGDNPHFVRDGCGYLVAVDDHAAMAAAMHRVLAGQHREREHISQRLAVGDWHGVAAAVIDFVNQVREVRLRNQLQIAQ